MGALPLKPKSRKHVVPRAWALAIPGALAFAGTWAYTGALGLGCAALLGVASVVAAVVFALDKRRAVRNAFRVPEGTLLGLAWMGGGVGALAAMFALRHKTLVTRFTVLVPLAAVVQIAVAVALAAM